MSSKVFVGIGLVALLCAPAAGADGWYVGLMGGYNETDDTKFATALGPVTTTFDSGSFYALNVGYDLGMVRIEGEIGTREADVQNHILGGAKLPGPTGDIMSTTVMANAIYDFNRGGKVMPYLGLGLGFADVELNGFGVEPIPDVLDDSDSSFAYQFLLGIGFALGENWALSLDYRWLLTDGLSLRVSEPAGGVSSNVDYDVQDIVLGVRYSF